MDKSKEVSLSQLESFFKNLPLYLNFKGKIVWKIGEAINTETGVTEYLYREFNPNLENWGPNILAIPMVMFLENIPFTHTPRFKPVTPLDVAKLFTPEELAKLLYPVINKTQNYIL